MGKRVEPINKIVQRSVGFKFFHHEFFSKHRDFKPDAYCRAAVNEQIKSIDPQFWKEKCED